MVHIRSGRECFQKNTKYYRLGHGAESVQLNCITLCKRLATPEDNDIKDPLGGDACKFKKRRGLQLQRRCSGHRLFIDTMQIG